MVFDKDDEFALEFVAASANLRAYNFSIQMENIFKIKEMAGKIVPAISSSNALVAALQTTEAIKLLANQDELLRGISYVRLDKNQRLSSLKRISELPNKTCKVCSDDSQNLATVTLKSISTTTLKDFTDTILKDGLQIDTSSISIVSENILYERDPDLTDEDEQELYNKRITKTLPELKIKQYSTLFI